MTGPHGRQGLPLAGDGRGWPFPRRTLERTGISKVLIRQVARRALVASCGRERVVRNRLGEVPQARAKRGWREITDEK